ncbi:MAG: ABC transporter, partial [Oscillospiraceae bacterium]|nr:ABC transporter [Oscillospiraceae bacterium]
MVEVKNLTKRYGKIKAVNDISFTVEAGEILGFLGP